MQSPEQMKYKGEKLGVIHFLSLAICPSKSPASSRGRIRFRHASCYRAMSLSADEQRLGSGFGGYSLGEPSQSIAVHLRTEQLQEVFSCKTHVGLRHTVFSPEPVLLTSALLGLSLMS